MPAPYLHKYGQFQIIYAIKDTDFIAYMGGFYDKKSIKRDI